MEGTNSENATDGKPFSKAAGFDSQERLMGIIASATDAIITVDDDHKITVFNAAAERMFRCRASEAIGQLLERFIPQRFRAAHGDHIRLFGETGVTTRAMGEQRPIVALRSDGVEFPVEATISQISVAGQKLFTAIVRDISERRRSEEALRESEGRLRAIVETAVDGIITIDQQGRITSFNPAAMRIFGYMPEEVMGKNVKMLMPAPYYEEHDGYLNNYRTTGVKKIIGIGREVTGLRKNGSHFPMDLAVSETRLGEQRIFTGIVREISDRKTAEASLRESEGRLRAIVETAVDGIITIDEQGLITSFNPAATRLFGFSPEEVLGKNVKMLMPEPYHAEHDGYLANYRDTRIKKIIGIGREVIGLRKDGTQFPIDLAVSETRLGDRRVFTGIVRDISERRQGERALAESQERLRGIISSATDAIITVDESQKVTLFNVAAEKMFQCPAEKALGRPLDQFIPRRFRSVHGEHIRLFNETGVTARAMGEQRPLAALRADGVEFPVEATISQITVAGQKLFTAIVRDISERKRADEALAKQAEELARSNVELERFAYVASHDLQEPMRTVRSFSQLLQRRIADSLTGEPAEFLRFITDGVQRMQNLIQDLLAYSRVSSQGAAFAPADCKDILVRVLENLRASIEGQHAEVTFDAMPIVIADATQLGQLFQNLLVNAIKFHGEDPPRIHIAVAGKDGEWVFSIKDNGIGIASEYFDRIFIIFQRLHTIEEYAGTGIGLAICKKIVERHGGRIWLESTVGEGSTFHFSIPKRERS